jgi:penicillin-binding protein 2
MTAVIANKGHYYTPHIIKSIENENMDPNFTTPKQTSINPEYYDAIIEGMHNVYNKGTASFLKVPGIEICGKTGTAENFTKIDGVRQQLTDHSIFVAFAPKEDPKIAIAILVENGYYGSRWAGRMASLMIEKYIKGDVTLKRMEKLVIEKSLENEYLKPYSGKPFKINDK